MNQLSVVRNRVPVSKSFNFVNRVEETHVATQIPCFGALVGGGYFIDDPRNSLFDILWFFISRDWKFMVRGKWLLREIFHIALLCRFVVDRQWPSGEMTGGLFALFGSRFVCQQ